MSVRYHVLVFSAFQGFADTTNSVGPLLANANRVGKIFEQPRENSKWFCDFKSLTFCKGGLSHALEEIESAQIRRDKRDL